MTGRDRGRARNETGDCETVRGIGKVAVTGMGTGNGERDRERKGTGTGMRQV